MSVSVASYLDLLFTRDDNNNITTKLYDKRDAIDDTAKGGLTYYILGTSYRDSLHAQTFKALITSRFEDT